MDANGRDARLGLLARRQMGAFSFSQALAIGFSRATISRRLATGAWVRLYPGVYVLSGTPERRVLALWAAVLAVGCGVITHESAALLHGVERLPGDPITLTSPHGSHHRLAGLLVHQIDDLRPGQRMVLHGLPVSTPARTVVELGATTGTEVLGRVADDLVRMQKVTYADISSVLADLTRPGKPGIERVATMLDERGDGFVPAASELEELLFTVLEAGGLPAPERQVPLPGRSMGRGLVDGAYRDAQMVLEADGRRWHMRVEAARRDRERDAQVVRAGWVPLRFVYEQLTNAPGQVCDIVRETREHRLELLRRAA
jgi:very-short-patch-repair endonuclease/predicted transcriptional regulator of viral defense system